MTWTPLSVVSCIVACEPPYSFYFNLIEPYWRTPPSGDNPLHRLSTLARKQGAKAVVFEDASNVAAVAEEISALDAQLGGGGAAEAILLTFLSEVPKNDDISTVSDKAMIGQCTLVNYRPPNSAEFEATFIYEAIFATPSLEVGEKLLNNYINCEATFKVSVGGRQFNTAGLYYAQQNGTTSVCAHACIRMATRTLFPDQPPPSTTTINALIGDAPPAEGMEMEQLSAVLSELTGHEVTQLNCRDLTAAEYVSVLTSAADSGEIALLIFETGTGQMAEHGDGDRPSSSHVVEAPPARHVVVVYGYTRNSDEWHPQAIPEYSGAPSALYSPSSAWVDHFVIHDDNYGPYLALSSRALETDNSVRANSILIVRRLPTKINAQSAEIAAGMVLAQIPQIFARDIKANLWLSYLVNYHKPLVTRPILMTREEYIGHLISSIAHDESKLPRGKAKPLAETLPKTLWVIEFTLPDLFSGNHAKLGEIIFDASQSVQGSPRVESLCGIRVPSRFMLVGLNHTIGSVPPIGGQTRQVLDFPITSHVPLYERNPPGRQW